LAIHNCVTQCSTEEFG